MAAKYWRGSANDGDFSNTNNWSATQYGATGAGAPASNDDVYILDGPDITAGLSQGSVDLNSMTVAFGGNIGSPTTSLTIAVSGTSNATLTYRGRGQYCNITAGTNGIDVLDIKTTGAGVFNLTGGTTVDVRCGSSGRLVVAAGAVISTSIKSAGMRLEIEDNATDIPTGEFEGSGQVTTKRDIDTVRNGPRSTYQTLENVTVDTSIDNYGTFVHHSTGTIALITARPGSRATAENTPANGFTVTASVKYEGSALFDQDPIVTWTAEPTIIGYTAR